MDFSAPSVCQDLKEKHDQCFFRWYAKDFLAGKATTIECNEEWVAYQQCIKKRLKAIDDPTVSDAINPPSERKKIDKK
ncbi:hypothetical protein PROFUN_12794 [Planoprotostelium fungivorum]|uniref:Uncharacterized protein n=1 Tax=Planoprotostelium fungivorum TaxID=1890364 RepID=A0A2P6N150_9EUKA|nr:hypothetical protein PROFUN_00512 [Planoprotostelium fungivorum]PRP79561.1 hypothetical protein PROFUN_12794 [Planoprotostelium fungivorum]